MAITPFQAKLAFTAAASNNIATSQSNSGTNLALTGSTVTGGVAVLDAARRVGVTTFSANNSITFKIVGTNRAGAPLSETITGPASAGAASQTTQDFLTITAITPSASVASNVAAGTTQVGSTPWFILDRDCNPTNIGLYGVITGTENYSFEYTPDDPNNPFTGTFPTVFAYGATATNSATSVFTSPAQAVRLTQNSFSNGSTVSFVAIQADLWTA